MLLDTLDKLKVFGLGDIQLKVNHFAEVAFEKVHFLELYTTEFADLLVAVVDIV